jgi:hypothetical protein
MAFVDGPHYAAFFRVESSGRLYDKMKQKNLSGNCDDDPGMSNLIHYKPLYLTFYSFALNNYGTPFTAKSKKAPYQYTMLLGSVAEQWITVWRLIDSNPDRKLTSRFLNKNFS